MFDKLIVSEPEGADFKNRRNYFMVSSLVVGVLFLAAVVFSIFASDYGLGNSGFELVEIVSPPHGRHRARTATPSTVNALDKSVADAAGEYDKFKRDAHRSADGLGCAEYAAGPAE